jgi:hypothetical protein
LKQVTTLIVLIVFVTTMSGCAGLSRTADPEDVYQDIDDVMSCESIKYELADINEEIQELFDKKKNKVS